MLYQVKFGMKQWLEIIDHTLSRSANAQSLRPFATSASTPASEIHNKSLCD